MSKDAIQLMGEAARFAAECSVAMSVANEKADKAATAFEIAARAQEELGLDAAPYWGNAAVFRGIANAGRELEFKKYISTFLEYARICQ